MTLALMEEDLGKELSCAVVRMLVMDYPRPDSHLQYFVAFRS